MVPEQITVINKYSEIRAVRFEPGFYREKSYSAHRKEIKNTEKIF